MAYVDKGFSIGYPCRNDVFGIPACFYWSVDEVADWIESIGYGKYKENFRSHFINGRRLLTVDACSLPKMGIVHFGDILALASCIKKVLGKGPKVQNFRSLQGSHGQYYRHREHLEYTCGSAYWFPKPTYCYEPKNHPITTEDFDTRWWNANCGHIYARKYREELNLD